MATIYGRIYDLERELDKPGTDFLSRRLMLRKAFEEVRAEALREGHLEGMRDARDADAAEREAPKATAKDGSGG